MTTPNTLPQKSESEVHGAVLRAPAQQRSVLSRLRNMAGAVALLATAACGGGEEAEIGSIYANAGGSEGLAGGTGVGGSMEGGTSGSGGSSGKGGFSGSLNGMGGHAGNHAGEAGEGGQGGNEAGQAGASGSAGEGGAGAGGNTEGGAAGQAGAAGLGGAAGEAGAGGNTEGGASGAAGDGGQGGNEGGQAGVTGGAGEGGAGAGGSSVTPGTLTIKKNGELTDSQAHADNVKTASYAVIADNVEDFNLNAFTLNGFGDCIPEEIGSEFKLYVEGNPDLIATSAITNGHLAFNFASPVKLFKGQEKHFYVENDIGCCGGKWETYISDPKTVGAIGTTTGLQANIDNLYTFEDGQHSTLNIHGGFNVMMTNPVDTYAVIGQKNMPGINLRIENCLPYNVDLSNPKITFQEINPVTEAGGFIDNSANPPVGNFTLFRMAELHDGAISKTIVGYSELDTQGSDTEQTFPLYGTFTFFKGTSMDASVVTDVAFTQGIIGDRVKLKLKNPNGSLFFEQTKNPIPADAILPQGVDLDSNVIEIAGSALFVDPVGSGKIVTIPKGTPDVELGCWNFVSTIPTTFNSLQLHRYGVGKVDDVSGLRLREKDSGKQISQFASISSTTQNVTFSSLNFPMEALNVYTICLDGDINFTAQAGNIDGFEVASADAVTVTPAPQIVKGEFPVQSTENSIASAQ